MGRIVTTVKVSNVFEPDMKIECKALVDTGSAPLVLPNAWKERLGRLTKIRITELELGDQRIITGDVYGPVIIQIEGFEPVYGEVVFVDMQPVEGKYEPLLGYIILEQSQVTVDTVGQRIVSVKHMDLK